jgi:hypothetical protein
MFEAVRNAGVAGLSAASRVEDGAAAVACTVHLGRATLHAVVALVVAAVASLFLAFVPKKHAVRATVVGATDSHTLQDLDGATVEARTVTSGTGENKRRVTVYDVRFPGRTQVLTCGTRPRGSTYPVSLLDGTVACPTRYWNTCAVRAAYQGSTYELTQSLDAPCASLVARGEGTYYHHPASDTLSSTNKEAVVRAVLRVLQGVAVATVTQSALRLRYVPVYCDFDMAEELRRVGAVGCDRFATAYNKAFRLDKLKEVIETAEDAARLAGKAVGGVVGGGVRTAGTTMAQLAAWQNEMRMMWHGLVADYELWRCATGGTTWASFLATTAGAVVAVFAVVAYAAHGYVASSVREIVRGEANAWLLERAAATAAAFAAGGLAASVVPTVLRGLRRRKLGLDFVDWPRLVM